MPSRIAEASLPKPQTASARRLLILTVLALCASYSYFFSGGGWNQATRFNLVRAVVEQGTLRIDSYHHNTGDKAEREGHYYCDKAPGVSLLAVPAVYLAKLVLEALDIDATTPSVLTFLAFLSAFMASSLPSIAGALALFWLATRSQATPEAAALSALAIGLGTPTFAYSILFWGHAAAGGFLIAGFAVGVFALDAALPVSRVRRAVTAGGVFGAAVLVEYPAAGAVVLMCLALLLRAYVTGGRSQLMQLTLGLGLGGLTPAVVLFFYQNAAFGSPFVLSYSNVQGFEGMQEGLFGVTFPRLEVLWELVFGSRRGLVFLAPCLIAAPFGFQRGLRSEQPALKRFVFGTALMVVAYYFLLNASYHYWDGGWSYGPRHIGPALPFLGLGVAAAVSGPRWLSRSSIALVAVSLAVTLPVLAVNPMPPEDLRWALARLYLPALLSGDFGQNARGYFDQESTANFNLGELLGLEGAASLLPLLAVWGLLWFSALKPFRQRATPARLSAEQAPETT